MRVLIVGAGGVGGLFGAKLAANESVTFLNRQGDHLAALQKDGLELTDKDGSVIVISPAQATFTDQLDGLPEFDVVVLSTKLTDFSTSMVGMIKSKLREDSIVLSLSNGVEATMQLATELGERVLAAQCFISSFKTGPGKIKFAGGQEKPILFGERRASHHFAQAGHSSASPRCLELQAVFERNGVLVDVPADADHALWKKFVFSSIYPFYAIARLPFSVGLNEPSTRAVLVQGMNETLAVARAHGVDLDDNVIPQLVEMLSKVSPVMTASTVKDVVAGKPSEVDGLSGAVIRLGKAATPPVPTPTHEIVWALMVPGEKKARGELSY